MNQRNVRRNLLGAFEEIEDHGRTCSPMAPCVDVKANKKQQEFVRKIKGYPGQVVRSDIHLQRPFATCFTTNKFDMYEVECPDKEASGKNFEIIAEEKHMIGDEENPFKWELVHLYVPMDNK